MAEWVSCCQRTTGLKEIPSLLISNYLSTGLFASSSFPHSSSPPRFLLLVSCFSSCRQSTSSVCTGVTPAQRRQRRQQRGSTVTPTWSGSTGWTGPSLRACTGCWRRGPAAPTSTPTHWPTAPSPCWTRTATTWSPSESLPAGWVGEGRDDRLRRR